MSSNLVLAPSFPALLDSLLEQLRQFCLDDPLAPKWIVVPTSTAADHLRLKLGQEVEEAVWAGVRIIPLPTRPNRRSSGNYWMNSWPREKALKGSS